MSGFTVSGYVEVKSIAGLVAYFKDKGVAHNRSYSRVINELVEYMVEYIPECEAFESTEAAISFLAGEGFSVSQLGDTRKRRTLKLHQTIDKEKRATEAQTFHKGTDTDRWVTKFMAEGADNLAELDLVREALELDVAAGRLTHSPEEVEKWYQTHLKELEGKGKLYTTV